MNHPIYDMHQIEQQIIKIDELLHDLNDNKASIIKAIKKIKKDIADQKENFNKYETKNKWDQTAYFETVKIEFTLCDLDDNLIGKHERKYEDYSLNMKMLKDIIYSERAMHNHNEFLLSAKITLLDLDENMHDGEV